MLPHESLSATDCAWSGRPSTLTACERYEVDDGAPIPKLIGTSSRHTLSTTEEIEQQFGPSLERVSISEFD
jgi:hypothetical protein